ncbi:MAG: DNA-3-methyladenine glycosylase [Propionibacteriaceae bacterium]|nr:DNA-3-methyladenine glycosylase [Propionibacteriaceae bacterium]
MIARKQTPGAARELLLDDPVAAAPKLLGATLTAVDDEGSVSVRLTEVEAYCGAADPGSHAYRGRTDRTATMFAEAGAVYVYFTYGMHHCVNLVCGPVNVAGAVLLRAGEIIDGVGLARRRRPAARPDRDLARGPARLCSALGLTRLDDGTRLGPPGSRLSLTLAPELAAHILSGPRTGVSGPGGDGEAFPWRFWLKGDPTVSPYRPAAKRHPSRKPSSKVGGG